MNGVLKTFLAMSISGSLLILALLLGKGLWREKVSRQWQYYIWLIVILRLLLPFGPEARLLGGAYQAVRQAIVQAAPLPPQSVHGASEEGAVSPGGWEESPAKGTAAARPLLEFGAALVEHLWLIWLAAALGLLLRSITLYQSFMSYIRAGWTPVSDVALLDRLSIAAEQMGIHRPVELFVNPLISSPLLVGVFRPCIVLPRADLSEQDFQYTVLHELTHCKRWDVLYKWLVQVTVCLHGFNPLVYLMRREIIRACEFSCDEAVLTRIGRSRAQDYGRTLLEAMAAVGRDQKHFGAVTLSENKQLLKERLGAIMKFEQKSAAIRLLTGVLTVCVMCAAVFICPTAALSRQPSGGFPGWHKSPVTALPRRDYAAQIERYYEAGSLPLLQITFSRLDESGQRRWLEKAYTDADIASFSVEVRGLAIGAPLIAEFAERAYEDGEIAFFSTLADCMTTEELELWLDRALEDGAWSFQSVLFDRLDKDDEWDERKEEWEEAQRAEYQAAGVTMTGKDYYYQGQLVNIFLDIRSNQSFYTLNLNPAGTVNVKIVRDGNDRITGAAPMTEAEVTQLLGDMGDDGEAAAGLWRPQVVPVDAKAVRAGETIFLGEYTLSQGDRIQYDISAKTGRGMRVYFARDGEENVACWSVHNLRQPGEPLKCVADFTVGAAAESQAGPGTYGLYLQASDSALGEVQGSISIG